MKIFKDFNRMINWVKVVVDPDVEPGELCEVFFELDKWYGDYENDIDRELKPFLTDRIRQLKKDIELKEMAEICAEGFNKKNVPIHWYWKQMLSEDPSV